MLSFNSPEVSRRLLLINPNTNAEVTRRVHAAARASAAAATCIDAQNPVQGPFSVEGDRDRAAAAPHVIDLVRKTLTRPYDGYVLACFDDIAIAEVRSMVAAPVISMAEAAIRTAIERAGKFAIVTTVTSAVPSISRLLERYGVADRCTVLATGFGVAETSGQSVAAEAGLRDVLLKARNEVHAEAIVLGSGAFGGRRTELATTFGIDIIDGLEEAVAYCERTVPGEVGHRR
jgi:allantoin racemase